MARQFRPGQLQTGSLYNISSSYAITASYSLVAQTLLGSVTSASYAATSSYSITAQTASYVLQSVSSSFAISSSYAFNSTTSSYALTASYVNPLRQNVELTGSLYLSTPGVASIYFTGSGIPGQLTWNDTDGTLELGLKGGVVKTEIGQGLVTRVVNKTSPNVDLSGSNYQVVVVTGAQGQRLAVKLAQADNDANSAGTLGIVGEDIAKNQEGFIVTVGLLKNRNTTGALQGETWNDGDILYLSPTTAGAITNIKPQAPQHTVIVGYVEYAHPNNGKIYVKIDNGYEIDELHNVRITTASLAPGQLLVRSGSNNSGVWINTNQLTGSYVITGSLIATSFTGSLQGTVATASYALQAVSASYYNEIDPIFISKSGSFATTASNIFYGNQIITGSILVTGSNTIFNSDVFNVANGSGLYTFIQANSAGVVINDANGILSINSQNRQLYLSNGSTVVVDWENRRLSNTNGVTVDWETKELISTGNRVSVDWENRELVASNGLDHVLNWNSTSSAWFSGSVAGTASFANNAMSSSYAVTASYALNGGTGGSAFPYTGSAQITGSLSVTGSINVTFGITGSLFGTSSWSSNAITASYVQTAQTASYVLNSISSSFTTTASYAVSASYAPDTTFPYTGSAIISGSLNVTGPVSFTYENTPALVVYGSGSANSVFIVSGSTGELFSVTDTLTGNLFTVTDSDSNSIFNISSSYQIQLGNPIALSLYSTTTASINTSPSVIYSIPSASYNGAWFEYTVRSGSNARTGQIMTIWDSSVVNFTETTTIDIGNTSGVILGIVAIGSNIAFTGSAATSGWNLKTIVRSI